VVTGEDRGGMGMYEMAPVEDRLNYMNDVYKYRREEKMKELQQIENEEVRQP
jgi:hypothetical protein